MPATTSNSEYGRREESIGLALAIAVHLGLAGFLLWRPAGKALVTPPERMTVTLSEELAPTSTSPEPNAQAAPDAAPEIGEAAPAPEPQPVAKAEPEALHGSGAGFVLTLRNTSIVFAAVLGWAIAEPPTRRQVLGAVLVAGGAILLGLPR